MVVVAVLFAADNDSGGSCGRCLCLQARYICPRRQPMILVPTGVCYRADRFGVFGGLRTRPLWALRFFGALLPSERRWTHSYSVARFLSTFFTDACLST